MALETLTAAEIKAIEDYRCGREWSYYELAVSISARTGTRMPEPTLYKALTEPGRPMRRATIYRFRTYLDLLAEDTRRAMQARAPRRAKATGQLSKSAVGAGR